MCNFKTLCYSLFPQIGNYYADHNNTLVRNVDYITAVRRQNAANIWLYNFQIEYFKEAYLSRIYTIVTVKEALMDELIRTDGRFYPLTILSDFSKECVDKYKSLIPSLASAKSEMERCIAAGTNQISSMLSAVSSANRTLETYYRTNFEKEIANCGKRFKNSASVNYTTCLVNAVS